MFRKYLRNKISKYRFEIRHITIFFTILILFQIVLVFVQKTSLNEFLSETQDWYKRYSAERLATITSTSMELLFENLFLNKSVTNLEDEKIVYSFNVIFKYITPRYSPLGTKGTSILNVFLFTRVL